MDNKLLRLPPGFRFHPTDEELVVQYLRRKVFSCPLPASIIPEITLGEHNPWDLFVGCEEERYFFNLRDAKHANCGGHGRRWKRATGSGYWKATGKDKAVVSSKCNRVVGTKKAFVFCQGRAPNSSATGGAAERTDWIMHEYRLASSSGVDAANREWALCRVFKKKKNRATKMMDVEEGGGATEFRFVDFMNRRGPPSPSGSESSCVTEVATDVPGGGEDISSSPCGTH